MTVTREAIIRPGLFGDNCAADTRRMEFDYGNESLRLQGVRPDALFIGDSITHLWELQAFFGGTGRVLINRGIGGDVSTNVRRRFEADALQLRPRLAVLLIGTNDLGWELSALDQGKSEQVCEQITHMAVAASMAGVPLALCSILPIWGPSWVAEPEFALRKNAQIVHINLRLRALAEKTGALFVDYHRRMLNADGLLRHELADDGVHPHAAGYAIMAETLRATLAEHGITL